MKLSNVYARLQYSWVYETGHKAEDSTAEVEFIENVFFDSVSLANEWFTKTNKRLTHFVNPRIVTVAGVNNLNLSDLPKPQASDFALGTAVTYKGNTCKVICNSLRSGKEMVVVEHDHGLHGVILTHVNELTRL